MFFILLLVGLVMGDGFGGTKADLVIEVDGDGSTWRWVTVTDPGSGRMAFATYRAPSPTGLGYFRSECWASSEAGVSRLENLMAMNFDSYRDSPMHPAAVGAAVDCGPRIAKRMLKQFVDWETPENP